MMKMLRHSPLALLALVMAALPVPARADQNPATDDVINLFPYTGTLEKDGLAVSDAVDMEFALYDAARGLSGTPIWIETQKVPIYRGRFTTLLGLCDQNPAVSETCPDGGVNGVDIETTIRNADDLLLGIRLFPSTTPIDLQNRKRFLPVPYAVWTRAASDLEVARDLIVRRNAAVTGNANVTGNATVGTDLTVTRNLTVSANATVVGDTATRDLNASRDVNVAGQVGIGLYNKVCNPATAGTCYCNATNEFPLSWGTDCSNSGHAVFSADWVTSGGLYGVKVRCMLLPGGGSYDSVNVQLMCARVKLNGGV